jgi:hypothetical protein
MHCHRRYDVMCKGSIELTVEVFIVDRNFKWKIIYNFRLTRSSVGQLWKMQLLALWQESNCDPAQFLVESKIVYNLPLEISIYNNPSTVSTWLCLNSRIVQIKLRVHYLLSDSISIWYSKFPLGSNIIDRV